MLYGRIRCMTPHQRPSAVTCKCCCNRHCYRYYYSNCWMLLSLIEYCCWARWTTSSCSRVSLATTSATEVLISRKREYLPNCAPALALHWLVIQRTWLLIKFTFWGFSWCQAGRQKMTKHSDEIWQEVSAVSMWFHLFFAIRILRLLLVSGGFHSGRPECLNFLFFNVQNFEFHLGILITFASKAATCDSRLRILSESATLSIRCKIFILA